MSRSSMCEAAIVRSGAGEVVFPIIATLCHVSLNFGSNTALLSFNCIQDKAEKQLI